METRKQGSPHRTLAARLHVCTPDVHADVHQWHRPFRVRVPRSNVLSRIAIVRKWHDIICRVSKQESTTDLQYVRRVYRLLDHEFNGGKRLYL